LTPASILPLLHFYFKRFFLASSFFQAKDKKNKEKKTHKEKKNVEKGGSFASSSHYALSLLAPASAFSLLPFCFKRFLLASSYFQTKEKKKKP
jgi:hypothetical protein